MTDANIVLFAESDNFRHCLHDDWMLILPGNTQLLAQIAFTDQHAANTWDVAQDVVEILDALYVLDHQKHQQLALGIQWPDICACVVFLLRQTPIPRGHMRSIPACPGWRMLGGVARTGIATGRHRIERLLD